MQFSEDPTNNVCSKSKAVLLLRNTNHATCSFWAAETKCAANTAHVVDRCCFPCNSLDKKKISGNTKRQTCQASTPWTVDEEHVHYTSVYSHIFTRQGTHSMNVSGGYMPARGVHAVVSGIMQTFTNHGI